MQADSPTIAVGVVPPPLNGKLFVTQHILDRLAGAGSRQAAVVKRAIPGRGWAGAVARVKMAWDVMVLALGFEDLVALPPIPSEVWLECTSCAERHDVAPP